MANKTNPSIESISELREGETVNISGNGLDDTGVVDAVEESSWSGSEAAYIMTDTHTWKVTDHPNGGTTAQVGAVNVSKE